ncbi:hypothetical protein I316_01547 [Kwoniella heveanensis BCC8398]|uniref:Striatin N-terminal domain-containing protein n=1 Tax=Kwoniella heveanensis BCC8398 TaxID=1296120 RepID=A0A1B9H106_9TREE|nr:hypothetical protein I316_01547 [Kwoniella heveanensis BCC8398]
MFRPVREQGYPPSQNQYGQPQSSPQYSQRDFSQQQQQQQHSQQQQQQQGQQHQAGSTVGDGGSGSVVGQGSEMNLASVLHYLQSEWRRWERDRNEWEIERAEMRARIALLEGQRRSAENLKVDLLRRVKMLEFALRQERTKTVSSAGVTKAGGMPPNRLATLQDDDKASSKDDKEGSGSEGSQEDLAERAPKVNGIHPAAMSKSSTLAMRQSATESSLWKNIGSTPRDPKSRARSREYLKQCLQEISYLTSPGALNPLPPQPPVDPNYPPPESNEAGPATRYPEPADRPRKELPEQPIPSPFTKQGTQSQEQSQAPSQSQPPQPDQQSGGSEPSLNLPNGVTSRSKPAEETKPGSSASDTATSSKSNSSSVPESKEMSVDPTARPPFSPAPKTKDLPPSDPEPSTAPQHENIDASGVAGLGVDDQGQQILTAIYRPDSKAAWREELRAANEQAEKAREDRSRQPEKSDEDALASLSLNIDEEETKPEDSNAEKVWTSRRTLKSHLDVVRSVAFAHGPGILLASGGDDCTVKVWSTDAGSIVSSKHSTTDLDPIITFRGHTAPVTSVGISTAHSIIFSASLDTTIRLWRIPPSHHDPFAPHDPSFELQTLVGHSDAIWDLGAKKKIEGRLVSASADGAIKLWEKTSAGTTTNVTTNANVNADASSSSQWTLQGSYSDIFDSASGEIPTCLEVSNSDYGKVLVGTNKGKVKVFDTYEGKVVQTFGEDGDGEYVSQVNAILSHPTLPAIITGHEDGNVKFYDAKSASSTPTHTILAHPSPVTSLSISPLSPTCILTSSVDCTVRLWDLQKKTSIQDLSGHRPKSGEGVVQVASHPELPVIATAGGDGIVRLWGAG